MTPIINPWVFYLMDVGNSIGSTLTIIGIAALIAFAISAIVYFVMSSDYGEDDSDVKRHKPSTKLFAWIAGISLLIASVIPSESTITKMLIAQNVTYDRVETAVDTVETVYNDIMELFESNE